MDSIKKLSDMFSKFPGIGRRTAGRFVYYLINQPQITVDELLLALQELKNTVKLCEFCFNPFEGGGMSETPMLCGVCQSPVRAKSILCVVEKEADLLSIEATKKYNGLYFILGGTLTLRHPNGEHLRIEPLKNRLKSGNFTEVIVALNPTPEGRSTSILVERALKELAQNFRITHLAQGLPVGGELEYADDETLGSAFEGRK